MRIKVLVGLFFTFLRPLPLLTNDERQVTVVWFVGLPCLYFEYFTEYTFKAARFLSHHLCLSSALGLSHCTSLGSRQYWPYSVVRISCKVDLRCSAADCPLRIRTLAVGFVTIMLIQCSHDVFSAYHFDHGILWHSKILHESLIPFLGSHHIPCSLVYFSLRSTSIFLIITLCSFFVHRIYKCEWRDCDFF
jgi:hypothetical protein